MSKSKKEGAWSGKSALTKLGLKIFDPGKVQALKSREHKDELGRRYGGAAGPMGPGDVPTKG